MDFTSEIVRFVSDCVGGLFIVSENSGKIAYASGAFEKSLGRDVTGMDAMDVFPWLADCPAPLGDETGTEWECIDASVKKYYKLNSAGFVKDGQKYNIHQVTDITEYMQLNRDVTRYMSFFKRLSSFQTEVLKKLSDTFYELLPMLADYFKTGKAYLLLQREGNMDVIAYSREDKQYSNYRIPLPAGVEKAFSARTDMKISRKAFAPEIQEILMLDGNGEDSSFQMLCSGKVSGQSYAVCLSVCQGMDEKSMKEPTLLSVIRLYIENGVMHEKLVYDSEHDQLTGLYNKGKYLNMLEKEYPFLDSIGIFNLDVNNLKVMNDTYGHEAGDRLLIKAADSIRKVTTNKVHGYRMGGDEFLMVACNVSCEEVWRIKTRWEEELARLNRAEDGINCVIAAGVVYGKKEYNLAELLKQADERMYEDKKRKKRPGEEIR